MRTRKQIADKLRRMEEILSKYKVLIESDYLDKEGELNVIVSEIVVQSKVTILRWVLESEQ